MTPHPQTTYLQAENIIYDEIAQHVGDLVRLFWADDEGFHDDFYTQGVNIMKDFVLEMMEAKDAERIAGAREALARAEGDVGGGAALEGTPIIIDGGVSGMSYGPKTIQENS
jgi:hypothetical protein